MTSVLGDKTAEASALKKEVVRLMDALSATQGALDKVHKDTYTAEDEGEDMKKQAIKQLSQLIKEKDMEIGALNQKNNTLLQVVGFMLLLLFCFCFFFLLLLSFWLFLLQSFKALFKRVYLK